MARDPVLTPSRGSSDNDERASVEEALLTGQIVDRKRGGRGTKGFLKRWSTSLITTYATLATIILLVIGVLYVRNLSDKQKDDDKSGGNGSGSPAKKAKKRNLIFMVSDGMGPTSLSMTRSFRQFTDNLPIDDVLTLDKHFVGSSRTRSSNSLVTDSAAGATAFGCGMKSYNGAIAVLPDGSPCGTVLEAAKAAGYLTGLVVTTSITDATPACFSAHVNMRWEQDRIAEQQIGDYPLGRVVDLILGGGLCHFQPNSTEGSCRADNRDLVTEAIDSGFRFVSNRAGFDYLRGGKMMKLPLLGLFAQTDIPYEIDRKASEYPSLAEMAEVALTALENATKDSDKGFFLMIEGSRIDHAGHGNDPAAQVREVLAYDKAFEVVRQHIDKSDVETVVVSTSDHETGGLATARQLHETYPDYLWYPSALANASASSEYLAKLLNDFDSVDKDTITKYVQEKLLPLQKITDASEHEIASIVSTKIRGVSSAYAWADIVSRRAQIGWTTHGHSAVDVNIYAYPKESAKVLWGNHENTEIGNFLHNWLDVDVDAVTKRLRKEGVDSGNAWMGRKLDVILEEYNRSMGVGGEIGEVTVEGLDHYHGVHKRCIHL